MELVSLFFEVNKLPIFFIYGLIFFLMGFAIFIRATVDSQVVLIRHLKVLGLFGIVHSFADWGEMFLPLQEHYFTQEFFIGLTTFKVFLTAVSFLILFIFAFNLISDSRNVPNRSIFRKLPYVMFAAWVLISIILFVTVSDTSEWINIIEALNRYLLAFPSASITFIAFYLQKEEFIRKSLNQLLPYIYLFVFSFALYAFTQLFPNPAPFKPALFLNAETFNKVTGIQIHFFRWISGLTMSIAVLRVLSIFDIEHLDRIKENERVKAVLIERNRIAMELHDGIIQLIYGLGLNLQRIQLIVEKRPTVAVLELTKASQKVNETISQIRSYIMELKDYHVINQDIKELIRELASDFKSMFAGKMDITFKGDFQGISFNDDQVHHILSIIKQMINNAVQHGKPKEILVECEVNNNELSFTVVDNGKGMKINEEGLEDLINSLPEDKQGLKNILMRVKMLNGSVKLQSNHKKGTKINFVIPINERR